MGAKFVKLVLTPSALKINKSEMWVDYEEWKFLKKWFNGEIRESMTINEYQVGALTTKQYGAGANIIYPSLKLNGEAGEVAEKVGKVLRDNNGVFTDEIKKAIAMEIGDVLWYCAALAEDLGFTLQEIAEWNLAKLASRRERGVISGNGDNR